jgi:hypothetical protein
MALKVGGTSNYDLPLATSADIGGVKLLSETANNVEASPVTNTPERTYGVQLNQDSQMVVNVPWTDTDGNVVGYLSNESHTISADSEGNLIGSLEDADGTFTVFDGVTNVTGSSSFTLSRATGLTATINPSTGEYTINSMTRSDGYVDFMAYYEGITVTKRFVISKSIAGVSGESVEVRLESSAGVVFRNNKGVDKVITASVYINGVRQDDITGYVYKWFKDGTPVYISPAKDYYGTNYTPGYLLADGVEINTDHIIVDPLDVEYCTKHTL